MEKRPGSSSRSVTIAALVFFAVASAVAQEAARITQPIDDNASVRVPRTTHPLARPANDRGRVDASLRMERMLLVLKPSSAQTKALRKLIDAQHNKESSSYQQWLAPEEYGAKFGPSESDVSKLTQWLKRRGFEVGAVSRGKQWIEFSGTAGQVERAFHTEMHHYTVKGEKHIANAKDVSLPAALMPVVSGVLSLHDFQKKSAHARQVPAHRDPATGKLVPEFTSSTGTFHALAPGDFARIYNTKALLDSGINGSGVSIAIVGRTDINLSDVETFRQAFGLPANDPVFIVNGTDPGVNGDEPEADLDVQWSGAVAPNATIKFVASSSTFAADGTDLSSAYIVDNVVAPIMSTSYGLCEAFMGNVGNAFYNNLYQQAAAEGITAFVASGDDGPAGCDLPAQGPAVFGANVSGVASTPFNVAVGGTQFTENGRDGSYWLANNRDDLSSAVGYIPEAAWNESCDPTVDPNQCFGLGYTLWSTSGGPSSCSTSKIQDSNIVCISGTPKPAWQAGIGVLNDGVRDIPDVSLAAAGHDAFIVCIEGACQTDTSTGHTVLKDAILISGTSASAPAMAGIMALLEQKNGSFQGLANYALYQIAAAEKIAGCNSTKLTNPNKERTCVFYDVTGGNNTVPGQAGYDAAKGYDMVTGLGSVNAANLVAAWSAAKKLDSSTTLSAGLARIQHGQPVPLNVSVVPLLGTGAPSGDFSLQTDNFGSVFGATLKNGAFASTVNNLPGGSYNFTARYGGDAMFSSSTSEPVAIKVSAEPSLVTAVPWSELEAQLPTPLTYPLPYGNPLAIQINVQGKSGIGSATGEARISLDGKTLGTYAIAQNGNATVDMAGVNVPPGKRVFSIAYSGDNSFQPATVEVPIKVDKGPPFTFIDTAPTYVTEGTPVKVLLWVGGSGGEAPTGTVSLVDNGKVVAGPFELRANGNHLAGTKLATTNVLLKPGDHTLEMRYSGDENYSRGGTGFRSHPGFASVAPATGAGTKISLQQSPGVISIGQSVNYTVSVRPAKSGGPVPTGTVSIVAQDGIVQADPIPLLNGYATFTVPEYQGGQYLANAAYSGDANYSASNSGTLITRVLPLTPTVSLSASRQGAAPGTTTNLTATVVGRPSNPHLSVPSGKVQFFDSVNGGAERHLGSPQFLTIGNGGNAIYTMPVVLEPGEHALRVQYLGSLGTPGGDSVDDDWTAASSNVVSVSE